MTAIPQTSGIYRITCTVTKKIYIGSAINLRKRRKEHFRTLRRKTHSNQYLQNAWNKYGEQSFTFEVVEYVLPLSLTAREQYWLDKIKPFGRKGFNLAPTAGSTLGCKRSPASLETRAKMRKSQTGRTHSAETIEKMRLAAFNRIRSPELGAHISDGKIGYMQTLIVTTPDGIEYTILGIKKFCREHSLYRSSLMNVANGKQSHHKGWKARYPDDI